MKSSLQGLKVMVLITIVTLSTITFSAAADFKVIILKFATHPALDEIETNFVNSLTGTLKNVKITTLNANGNPISAKQLAESATRPGVDLIVTLATPATQAVAKTPSSIPLLYAAVADPEGAGVALSRSSGIQNASLDIIKKALTTITNLVPNAKRIGSIYNPTEQNSQYVQDLIKRACGEMNLILEQRAVSNPNHFPATVEQLRKEIDVLYCANDNLVNKGAHSIATTAAALKLPFVIGELSAVSKGAVAGIGVEYSSMGKHLGELAAKILTRKPNEPLPPREGPPAPQFWLNLPIADQIDLKVPDNIKEKSDKLLK
ncbi:MAG: ABC transporter substrate-binding protein [Verrucomicrobiota bacterium]